MMQRDLRNRSYVSPRRAERPARRGIGKVSFILAATLVLAGLVLLFYMRHHRQSPINVVSHTAAATTKTPSKPAAVSQKPPTICASNTIPQVVYVSISQRHLWACSDTAQVYDSAVVTGMENLPADLTPTGTYHIYAKQTGLYLDGSDSTGSWHDYVYYWMPFLSNQYGVYGFHDATWRQPNDFGTISPYASNASHGCVELPLATAKWLYSWASVGTSVVIQR